MKAKIFTLIILFLLCIVTQLVAKTYKDSIIVPGVRVGSITSSTTKADLIRDYGKGNVKDKIIYLGEGEDVAGTVLFPNDPVQRIYIIWKNSKSFKRPAEIRITDSSTKWKTKEGITIGTTLKELETMNGAPFHLTGFQWDYEGTVVDCGKGSLSFLGKNSPTGKCILERKMILRLRPTEDKCQTAAEGIVMSVMGDRVFSSDCTGMQELNPAVYEMIIIFP